MSREVNIHFENMVVEGFSKREGAIIVKTIKSSLATKFSQNAPNFERSGFITQVQLKPIAVNKNMRPVEIGHKAADSIYKTLNK